VIRAARPAAFVDEIESIVWRLLVEVRMMERASGSHGRNSQASRAGHGHWGLINRVKQSTSLR
jgi:hypothetical protein